MSELAMKRTVGMTKLSIATHAAIALGKIILGIASLSLFLLISAGYNVSIALAKYNGLTGIRRLDDEATQRRVCTVIGGLLLTASLAYMVYSIRMFVSPPSMRFSLHMGIVVASFTFAEIFINGRGMAVAAKQNQPLLQAIRLTSLAGSIICLALTQVVLLSFAHPGGDVSRYNGWAGIIFGGMAALIGLYIILRTRAGAPQASQQQVEE